jgi:sulfur-oxidizing protein SoxY
LGRAQFCVDRAVRSVSGETKFALRCGDAERCTIAKEGLDCGDVVVMTDTVELTPNRRQTLSLGLGVVGAVVLRGTITPAYAANGAQELIWRFTGGKLATRAKVTLDLPDIAENGNSIRMALWVESPMTEREHITDVLVVANGNSHCQITTFHFSPASGLARVVTRIRLDSMQSVVAAAKMNDGSCYITSKEVQVALGGCCG